MQASPDPAHAGPGEHGPAWAGSGQAPVPMHSDYNRNRGRTSGSAGDPAPREYFDLGQYITVLAIPDDAPIDCQRTLSSRGHHTLRGDPAYLLGCVVSVVKI